MVEKSILDMKCICCGYPRVSVELLNPDYTKTLLCPNCAIIKVFELEDKGQKLPVRECPCVICGGKEASVLQHDFLIDKPSTLLHYYLCDKHWRDLTRLRLNPKEVKKIISFEGVTFYTHSDFYNSKGEAVQAKE